MKLVKIILRIVFVVSILLNVVVGLSTTGILAIKDSEKIRMDLSYKSYAQLSTADELSVFSDGYNSSSDSDLKQDFSCKKNETGGWACKGVVEEYQKGTENLIRTAYYPGDDNKYIITADGNTKTKTAYTNIQLENHFKSLIGGPGSFLLFYLPGNNYDKMKYDTNLNFDFRTFQLIKTVKMDYISPVGKIDVDFKFTGDDKIKEIYYTDETTSSLMKLSYKQKTYSFPSFEGYTGGE